MASKARFDDTKMHFPRNELFGFWRVSSIEVYYYTNITQAVKDLVKSCDLMLGLERNKGCTHASCRNMTDS